MSERVPYDERRYSVYSRERKAAESVPAGRYDSLDEAIAHCNTVTYGMYGFDRMQWEVVYRNWKEKGEAHA